VTVNTSDEDDNDDEDEDNDDNDKTVTLTKTDDHDVVRPGEVVTYRIVVRNEKDNDLTEVKIVDRIPQYMVPLATSHSGRADAKNRTITWDNQTISAGAEVTYTIQVRVAVNAPDGFLLQNIVNANGPGLRLNAVDTSIVQGGVVAGTSVTPSVTATSTGPLSVPTSAQTGTPLDTVSLLLSLVGSASTAGTFLLKRFV